MIELRTKLSELLKAKIPNQDGRSRVHYQTAPANTPMPYLIFNFLPSFMNGDQEVIPLDIDVWDNQADTNEIETVASELWKDLRKYRHLDADIQFVIYRESRVPELDESELGIRRRKLTFQIRYFDRIL